MAKRDLSDAEHEQRVNAARSRWAETAIAVNAAAAVGGIAAGAAQRSAVRKAKRAVFAAQAPSREAEATLNERLARIDARAKAAKLTPTTANRRFLDGAKKAMGLKVRLAAKELRDVSPPAETFMMGDGSTHTAYPHVPEMNEPAAHLVAMKERFDDLKLRGKIARRVPVEAAMPTLVSAHIRSIRLSKPAWSQDAAEKLHILLGHAGLAPIRPPNALLESIRPTSSRASLADYADRVKESISHPEDFDGVPFERVRAMLQREKVKSLDDVARIVATIPRGDRASFLEAHMLPAQTRTKKTTKIDVTEGIRGRGQHTRVVDGYPRKPARKHIAKIINHEIGQLRDMLYAKRLKEGALLQVAADERSLRASSTATRVLGALEGVGTIKAGAIGAVAAGLAAYFYANRSRAESNNVALGKAEGEPTIEEGLKQLPGVFEAGSAVEKSLASRLTSALTGLKDDIKERLVGPRGGSIHDTMLTDLDRALRPVDTAMKAGAAVVPKIEDPRAYDVALTFKARSALPEAFIQSYRLDRVRELAADQRDAIKAVLLSAAKDGAPPAEMARRIRQTVGLTTHQAGLVLNYRRQLETGNKMALTRALRDKRYDGVVTKAIAGKKLTTEQVDKLTDAYHRKFLAYRATTIARTESLRAANNGHIAGVEQVLQDNPDMDVIKTWMATNDSRTRHDHRALDGQSVTGLDTPFVADDGTEIRWPHDPDASAAQVVNCRCTISTSLVPRTST